MSHHVGYDVGYAHHDQQFGVHKAHDYEQGGPETKKVDKKIIRGLNNSIVRGNICSLILSYRMSGNSVHMFVILHTLMRMFLKICPVKFCRRPFFDITDLSLLKFMQISNKYCGYSTETKATEIY